MLIPDHIVSLIAALALVGVLVLFVMNLVLARRIKKMLTSETHTIEDTLGVLVGDTEALKKDVMIIAETLEQEQKRIDRSLRGVGVVRFNAFAHEGNGGNASFATALVNEGSNGILITGLTGRGETRVYVRPLLEGKAPCELMPEEAEAVALAQKDIA